MRYLAIDIGGTFIKYAIVNTEYKIEKNWKVSTQHAEDSSLYEHLFRQIPTNIVFAGIGISVPGIVDNSGIIQSKSSSTLKELFQKNIRGIFMEKYHVPVSVINDGKAAGLYECKFGYAKIYKHCICLVIGTGIGGCLCFNGKILSGKNNAAGEFHIIPYYDTTENKIRNLGDKCKIKALEQKYFAITGKYVSSHEIFILYKISERIAQTVVDEWITDLSILLLTITVTYNPEIICIGGAISSNEDFMDTLSCTYKKLTESHLKNFPNIAAQITRCSESGNNNLLGAIIQLTDALMPLTGNSASTDRATMDYLI